MLKSSELGFRCVVASLGVCSIVDCGLLVTVQLRGASAGTPVLTSDSLNHEWGARATTFLKSCPADNGKSQKVFDLGNL